MFLCLHLNAGVSSKRDLDAAAYKADINTVAVYLLAKPDIMFFGVVIMVRGA